MSSVMQRILGLGWSIEGGAPLWVQARAGNVLKGAMLVDVVIATRDQGVTVMIDAKPDQVAFGAVWRRKMEGAVRDLSEALGAPPTNSTLEAPSDAAVQVIKVPLVEDRFEDHEWQRFHELADQAAPLPAKLPMTRNDGGGGSGATGAGGGAAGLPVGKLLRWVVKEVGGALVAIGVNKVLSGDDDAHTTKGELEYELSTNQMLIRWADGSTTLAPEEYQPRGA
jgi:hypothetical protein